MTVALGFTQVRSSAIDVLPTTVQFPRMWVSFFITSAVKSVTDLKAQGLQLHMCDKSGVAARSQRKVNTAGGDFFIGNPDSCRFLSSSFADITAASLFLRPQSGGVASLENWRRSTA